MSKTTTALKDLFLVESSASSNLLEQGRHYVTIESISGAEVKHDAVNDPTPQAKMVMRHKDGRAFTDWLNLVGYKRMADLTEDELDSKQFVGVTIGKEEYAMNAKTGVRVKDKKRTTSALSIIAQIGYASGIPEGNKVTPQSLIGRQVGINVEPNEQGNLRVKNYFSQKATAKA